MLLLYWILDLPTVYRLKEKRSNFKILKWATCRPFFSLFAIRIAEFSMKELRLYFPALEIEDTIFLKRTHISKVEARVFRQQKNHSPEYVALKTVKNMHLFFPMTISCCSSRKVGKWTCQPNLATKDHRRNYPSGKQS